MLVRLLGCRAAALFSLLGSLVLLMTALPVAAQPRGWSAGPGASGDNTYVGSIDVPPNGASVPAGTPLVVGGWVVDRTAQGWAGIDGLQVANGQIDNGGTVLASSGIVGQNRPDVAAALGNPAYAASGFSATVPAGALSPGQHTLYVYAHTPAKGSWYMPVTVNVTSGGGGGGQASATPSTSGGPILTVIAPMPEEAVSTQHGQYTIRGNAYDPGAPSGTGSGVDQVQVYINGPRETGTQLGGVTLNTGNGDWNVTFYPTRFPSMHANLYVYARSALTGKETMVLRGFDITDSGGD
ncbi:MAG: hypothetical protein JO023_23900 [Chloroflexi bacterium]|nr:hypothetical protein [Chloroflexota bacterium]